MSERPRNGESEKGLVLYTKIYTDPEKDVGEWFRKSKAGIVKRLKKLPSDNLPAYAEPRIRALYSEAYQIFTLGFNNAIIVMCGILLEAMLKEIIYFRENKDFTEIVGINNADLGHAISFCEEKGYINGDEVKKLRLIKDQIRNPYLHSNVEKITKHIGVHGWKIQYKNPKELLEKMKLIMEGKLRLPSPKIFTVDDLRAVGDIVKGRIDEEISLGLFLDVDSFVRTMVKRHFEPKTR